MIARKWNKATGNLCVLRRNSEKARIPAWTDRILRKGSNLRQTAYGTAPLRFSDHRPVYATFQCTVSIVDTSIRESLSREIYSRRRADVGNTVASARNDDTDDEDIIGYDSIEPGLPPASSDRRKWWLDKDQPARSTVKPDERGQVPNPNRPSNPFVVSKEPDWVTLSKPVRMESYQSTASSVASTEPRGRMPPPRKLPPPLEQANSLPINPGAVNANKIIPTGQPSPSSSLRRLSTASSQTSLSKKTPPPVAKKPVHLTSSGAATSPVGQNTVPNGRPGSVFSTSSRSMAGLQTNFPPPPRRATDALRQGTAETPPLPPPRRPEMQICASGKVPGSGAEAQRAPSTPLDLLGDGGEEPGLKGWDVLKPSST